MSDDETDRVTVEYEVTEVERIDRGPIMAVASVKLSVAGVELLLQGITLRRANAGHADILPPTFRCPRTGRWFAGVILPEEVWGAIAVEVAERVTGHPARPAMV